MVSVAFVVPEMLPVPPVQGGAVEGWVHEVSGALALRGFEVTVVSRPAGPEAAGAPGVRYLGVPWTARARRWADRRRGWRRWNPLRPLVKAVQVAAYASAVREVLARLAPDIVYVHNDPWLVGLLGRVPGRATLLHMHNDHLAVPWGQPLLSRIVARCDAVLCVSDYIRDRARHAHPASAARIATLLNAIAMPPPPAAPRGDIGFLYVGRLVREKGVDVLLRAFERLVRERPWARLTIVGSSFFAGAPCTPFEHRLRDRARALGHLVRFAGYVPRERLWTLYGAARAVVMPSTWGEPFGLVAVEAMACAAPVIASRAGALPEIVVAGGTGLLVAPGDVDDLLAALLVACDRPDDMRRLGQAGRVRAEDVFALPHLVEQLAVRLHAAAPARQDPQGTACAPAVPLNKETS